MAGEHAQEDVGAHPRGEPVVDRPDVQIGGLQAAEGALGSGCGHAWTPRRDFAVSKSVTQSLTVGSVAFQKAGAHQVTLRADPVTGRLAVRLALQALENRVHLAEPVLRVSVSLVSLYTNPPSAGPEAVRRGRDHANV